jgi:DNA-binding transcriptional LysR family regulator
MELRDIEYFAVIAEQGNVRRASELLDLSPPALSKSLRRLEKSLQVKLVQRTPKGVELTPVGSALAAQVQRIRLTLADVAREATDLSQGRAGHLRIGVGPGLTERLHPAYAKLVGEAPGVTMEISVTDNDVMLPALRKGELDIVFNVDFERPVEGLIQEHLFYDHYVVCASVRHRLAKQNRVSMAELSAERWIMQPANVPVRAWLAHRFQQGGLPAPRAAVETRSATLRLQLLAVSTDLAFGSRHGLKAVARELGLKELPVKELVWRRSVCVFRREEAYLSPAARRMIQALKTTGQGGSS